MMFTRTRGPPLPPFTASNEDVKTVLTGGSGWTEEQTFKKRGLQEEVDNGKTRVRVRLAIFLALPPPLPGARLPPFRPFPPHASFPEPTVPSDA